MDFFYIFLDFIKINIENNFIFTFLLFFVFLLFYNAFSIPGNLVFIASSGYFFGIYLGFILSISSLVLGSLFFFIFSKFFLKKIFPNIYLKYSNSVSHYISNSSTEYLIIFRIIPGTPLMIQNLCLSLLDIKKTTFILTSLVGISLSFYDLIKDFFCRYRIVFKFDFTAIASLSVIPCILYTLYDSDGYVVV